MPEIEHLVEHHLVQPLDTRHAVADLANDADLPADGGDPRSGDAGFQFLYQGGHAYLV